MQKSINLIIGCHSHQPVGNFDHVFEEAYHKAYKPFLDVLERFPAIKVTHHYSGPLLDWFAANQPGFLERLAGLVSTGQVEIMGGGYYEPLLCAIPARDSVAQIERMTAFCEHHFGQKPKGMWLTERVWEPHMPSLLHSAGIEYTALDDMHFMCSGLHRDELFGCYVTEDQGAAIKAFPILEPLRYMIPFHPVQETIEYLRANATEDGKRCAVIHDDGEKFGIWPGTFHSVYEEGWLEQFFQAITDNQDWLQCRTYSEYMEMAPPVGRTYITCASYQEMLEWALPTPMQRRLHTVKEQIKENPDRAPEQLLFVRGGFWRNFLGKYAESNNIQKRMLMVSRRLDTLRPTKHEKLEEAEKLLHQGQCNCAYWHGVFGGLYLNHLRTALYQKLIEADRILDTIERKAANWVNCEAFDFDADGHNEAVMANAHTTLLFSPADGGTLFEWDYKDKPFNFTNTLTRRDEPYHDALRTGAVQIGEIGDGDHSIHELVRAKEAGLEKLLAYDPYRRVCLRDHFLAEDVTTEELWAGVHRELGDFATGLYTLETGKSFVRMRRTGTVCANGSQTVELTKTIEMKPRASGVEIRYDIRNASEEPLQVLFGTEFAVNLLSGSAFDRYYRSDDKDLEYAKLGQMGLDEALGHIALRDDWQKVEFELRFDQPARLHRFAIDTVSQSEGGQERVYQGSIVVPCWKLDIAPGHVATRIILAQVNEL